MEHGTHFTPLSITAARDGGFVVLADFPEQGRRSEPLFAGTILECANYIVCHFSPKAPSHD